MLAVDTNLIVRLVTNDEPKQVKRATQVFESDTVFVAKTVLLETEWVLRYTYQLDRDAVVHALRSIIGLHNVALEDEDQVVRALDWFARGLDFADALHLASCIKARRFVTLDEKLVKRSKPLGAMEVVLA